MAKKNEVVEKKKQEIAEQTEPARGFEDDSMDQDDLIIPRAKLLQALSPEIQDNVEGCRQGMIINSLTQHELPEIFIPIFVFKNYIRFNPRKKEDANFDPEFEPGAIIWKSNDHKEERIQLETKFGANGEKPLATVFMNFLAKFDGVDMPIIISFSKTSYKAGKNLYSLAKLSGGDMFGKQYKLTSKKETNEISSFFILKTSAFGLVDKDVKQLCLTWWNDYGPKMKEIIVHDEAGDAEVIDGEEKPF